MKLQKLPAHYPSLSMAERREVRQQYQIEQNGLCSHCGERLDECPSRDVLRLKVNKRLFPKFFFNWPIHLHHNHGTGMTIGAVHAVCNAVLWQYYGE